MSDSPPVEHGEGEEDARAIHVNRAQGMQVGDHAMQSNRFEGVTANRDALVAGGDINLHVHVGDGGDAVPLRAIRAGRVHAKAQPGL